MQHQRKHYQPKIKNKKKKIKKFRLLWTLLKYAQEKQLKEKCKKERLNLITAKSILCIKMMKKNNLKLKIETIMNMMMKMMNHNLIKMMIKSKKQKKLKKKKKLLKNL